MTRKQRFWINRIRSRIESRLDQTIWPGFHGLSMLVVLRFFIEAVTKGAITTRAAAIAFRLFLAVFPALILLLSLIPYVPIPHFQEELFTGMKEFFPGDTFSLVETTLDDLVNKKYNTLVSVGFILVIYYASNSINAILLGFNESYHFEDNTHPILRRVLSVILIFVLGIVLTTAITLIVFSESIIGWVDAKNILGDRDLIPILDYSRWIITIILIYTIITTLYNVGMGVRRRRNWKFWNVGAVLAAGLFIITSLGFAYFVNNFAQFNKLYGSLGTLMVLLIWTNMNCIILLAGFDLNASIRKALKSNHMRALDVENTPSEIVNVVQEDNNEKEGETITPPSPIKNQFKN